MKVRPWEYRVKLGYAPGSDVVPPATSPTSDAPIMALIGVSSDDPPSFLALETWRWQDGSSVDHRVRVYPAGAYPDLAEKMEHYGRTVAEPHGYEWAVVACEGQARTVMACSAGTGYSVGEEPADLSPRRQAVA